MRRALAVSVLLTAAAAGWLSWALWRPGPDAVVTLTVAEGETARAVLERLRDAGLLPSVTAARVYLRVAARGRSPRFGSYRFAEGCRPVEALQRILEGRVETVSVTIVEGATLEEIGARLEAAGLSQVGRFEELQRRVDWIDDLAPRAISLEGFLFPDTYSFAVGLPVEVAVRHMLGRFREVWGQELATAGPPWGSVLDVVTLASLVEAETAVAEERGRVAGVFFNRLGRGMLLQCDPTVAYALRQRGEWTGRLLRAHWQVDHPYNTYRYPGLPPGPINSPGRAALAAAFAPERHEELYFVAHPSGGHTFSRTLTEHNRAVARLQRARR